MRKFVLLGVLLTWGLLLCAASPALAGDPPDFGQPTAVLADIRGMLDQCTKAGDKNCLVKCGYAHRTLTNYIKSNPSGDPGIMKQRWQPCFEAHRDADIQVASAAPAAAGGGGGGGTPDFSNHQAVVASLQSLKGQCGQDAACLKECGYAIQSMKNFNHPQPHYVALRKGKWEKCRSLVPGLAALPAKAKPQIDRSRFKVAGLQMGGDMAGQKQRCRLLEAYGWHKQTKAEHNTWILNRGKTQAGPDVIRNYKGLISEKPVYIHFEADAQGKVYMIQFEQKEGMDIEAVKKALIERYGKPTRHQGNYIFWGCDQGPQKGFCAKAEVNKTSLGIWCFDEDLKNAAYKAYEEKKLAAQGIKKGAKF